MTRAKISKAAPLAKFGLEQATFGDQDRARQPDAEPSLTPIRPRSRERYTRGPFYLKIEGLTGPRPTSEELNAGRGWK